jgi:hypothetical protein
VRSRAPHKYSSKSRLNWNIFPRSSRVPQNGAGQTAALRSGGSGNGNDLLLSHWISSLRWS